MFGEGHPALQRLVPLLVRVGDARLAMKRRLGWLDTPRVQPYHGYGTAQWLRVDGRVVEREGITGPTEQAWRNVVTMLRRIESDEIPGARLRAHFQGRTWDAVTDHEGYFRFDLESAHPLEPGWHDVEVELLESIAGGAGQRVCGVALVPDPRAEFGVISDMDDTVLVTSALDAVTMLRLSFLHSARTRSPFPGVAALYRALQRGPSGTAHNPIFYVSLSGWNLYDLLARFLEYHQIPRGPLFLHDYAVLERPSTVFKDRRSKRDHINHLLRTYPALPFLLMGDSGQHDPEIYAEVVREHPGRIRAIYIRDVTNPARDREVRAVRDQIRQLGVEMVLARDSVAVAEHAAEHGYIAASALPAVRSERVSEQQAG